MEEMHPEILEEPPPPTPITNNDSASSSSDMGSFNITEMREDQTEIEAPSPPTPITCLRTFINRCRSLLHSENNDRAGSSSDQHEQHRPKNSIIDIKELEELMKFLEDHEDYNLKDIHVPVPQRCIYKVPKNLREINETAYTPRVVSIGPLHHGDKEFIEMEKQKLRYMLEFSKRVGAETVKKFKRFIEDNEQDIRSCYQENPSLLSPKFVSMILHDAVFIIEVLLKYWLLDGRYDFFRYTDIVILVIFRDLQLLENQLPYFVLQKLIELGDFHNVTKEEYPDHDPLLILSHNIFLNRKPGHDLPKPDHQILHFTDLRRYFLLMNFYPVEELGEMRDLPTATKLHNSGVKFKMGNEDSIKVSCKDVKNAIRIPWIKGLELQIPRFKINEDTECLYRNMMALEQCHYPFEIHICNFIRLMDHLIDTVKDVDVLVDKGIIVNSLGDNAAILTMFNKLCLQIEHRGNHSSSYNISKKLKEHNDSCWATFHAEYFDSMETLKTVYFGDIWKGTATVGAVTLLVLTFIQTVFSIRK